MTGTPRGGVHPAGRAALHRAGRASGARSLPTALIAEGFDLPGDLYTLDEVCHAILALKKEGRAC